MRRLVCVLLALVLVACAGTPATDASGEEIYRQLCASCHARDLSGGVGPALGEGSNAAGLSDEVLTATITHGRGSRMPAFEASLSNEQISRLVAYLRQQQSP